MLRILLISLLIFLKLTSCEGQADSKVKSDTTSIIEFAIRETFADLPDASLVKGIDFTDSILFTSHVTSINLLPTTLDSLRFKILSKEEACRIIAYDTTFRRRPNYFCLRLFQQKHQLYYIRLASLSCFEEGGGGEVYLEITKENESFVIRRKINYSIN